MKMAQRKNVTKKRGSFRKSVVISLVLISVISLALTGMVSQQFMTYIGDDTTSLAASALREQAIRNMELTAEKNALVINQKLARAEGMIRAMANECEQIFSDESTVQPREAYYDYFFENPGGPQPDDNHYEEGYGLNVSWTYSSWYHPSANSTNYNDTADANAEKLGRASNLDFIFQGIHQQMPEFRWLYLAFTNDLFINYPGSILDLESYSATSQPWYIDILSGSPDITYVEPYFDEFEGVLLISIGRVVRYDNGSIIGVISGDISVADINEKILDVQVLESGYASLIEKSGGGIIAHPDLSPEDYAEFWVENEILMPLTEMEINNDSTEALSDAHLAQIRSVQAGGVGNLTYIRNGESHLLVYASVERGNYIVVIIVPEDEVLSAIPPLEERIDVANQQALAFILAITVGGIIVAGAVAIVISNQITRPLQYLMDLATRNVEA
ncbi:MAG: hypothetical protein GQ580_05345, partial [Candidatus Thorarchaeota archaeon]|nr:hypothetical protein [Candidatus Thorarchaeota archaeon]